MKRFVGQKPMLQKWMASQLQGFCPTPKKERIKMFKKIRKVFDRVDAFEKRHCKLFRFLNGIWICIVPLIFHVVLQYCFIKAYGAAPTQEEYNLITGASFALAYLFAIITISEQSEHIRRLENVGQNRNQDKSGKCDLSDSEKYVVVGILREPFQGCAVESVIVESFKIALSLEGEMSQQRRFKRIIIEPIESVGQK